MEIIETEKNIKIKGFDGNGTFTITILKDCSQFQLTTGVDDAYIETDYRELKKIRDSITKVLDLVQDEN